MEHNELEKEILDLIALHTEGVYWDFKQEWHLNNTDLIHDIICMANSPSNRDCYIIIGVEDNTYNIIGANSEKRKNQQNVIDLLRQKPKWAGGYIPEIYVKTIYVDGKEIDVIIIKQSNNTPFYLLEDYKGEGNPIFKGAIYTRKGDTNTPKTSTADLYDTELLWKRRLGLLYNPSQRAKFYLKDIENWERVEGEKGKCDEECTFFFYNPDPDYTIYFIYEENNYEDDVRQHPEDINDEAIGETCYYLFAFCNVSYHTDFSNSGKMLLYYKDIPLYSNYVECVDEGRTTIIPPNYWDNAYYIKDSIHYLMFEFVFYHLCGNYSLEAKEMFMRVIPLYENEEEYKRFTNYIKTHGFSREGILEKKMDGESLKRLNNTKVFIYDSYGDPTTTEIVSAILKENKDLVINFANPKNPYFDKITRYLKIGKMIVDWLKEWRDMNTQAKYE